MKEELIIDSDTGDVDLNNCSFTRLKIENDVGDVGDITVY